MAAPVSSLGGSPVSEVLPRSSAISAFVYGRLADLITDARKAASR